MQLLPTGYVEEAQFPFYNKGREMWQASGEIRDDLEDKFRHQLEKSDMLQGFQVCADVNTGHGSLANMMATEYIRDEVPKAPILLYAIETPNPFKRAEEENKWDLFKLNKCLWLGEMLPTFDLVVPFNALYMQQTYG